MSTQTNRELLLRRLRIAGIAGAVIAIGTATAGILGRTHDESTLRRWTDAQAIPTVAIVAPQTTAASQDLVFPGNLRAYIDAPIYARVTGYLKHWYVDIGAHVEAGQLLAEIETPELDQQVQQAEADLEITVANEQLAKITANRWKNMLAVDSVSKQEADEKAGDYEAKRANTQAARANLQRLREIEGFKKIVAPFAGVVTARRTDVGALINAGAGNGQELFRVSDTHKARVYVEVPQTYASFIHRGMQAQLTLPELQGQTFSANVVDTSQAISETSRTLLVQLEADNKQGALLPGAYAEVHLSLPDTPGAVRIPTSALLFQQHGLQVAILDKDNKAHLRPIKLGRDFGTEVEVIGGLKAEDRVIDSPPDSINDNEQVRIVDSAEQPGAKEKKS